MIQCKIIKIFSQFLDKHAPKTNWTVIEGNKIMINKVSYGYVIKVLTQDNKIFSEGHMNDNYAFIKGWLNYPHVNDDEMYYHMDCLWIC